MKEEEVANVLMGKALTFPVKEFVNGEIEVDMMRGPCPFWSPGNLNSGRCRIVYRAISVGGSFILECGDIGNKPAECPLRDGLIKVKMK
jgi:hypothetical protein